MRVEDAEAGEHIDEAHNHFFLAQQLIGGVVAHSLRLGPRSFFLFLFSFFFFLDILIPPVEDVVSTTNLFFIFIGFRFYQRLLGDSGTKHAGG